MLHIQNRESFHAKTLDPFIKFCFLFPSDWILWDNANSLYQANTTGRVESKISLARSSLPLQKSQLQADLNLAKTLVNWEAARIFSRKTFSTSEA